MCWLLNKNGTVTGNSHLILVANEKARMGFRVNGVVFKMEQNQVDRSSKIQINTNSKVGVRVLFLNRPNALTHRGGDTVVMEKVAQALRSKGYSVEIDLEGVQPIADFDLVHLFNFATPEFTEAAARRCAQAGVPYVVTALYEDRPKFFHQMQSHFNALASYVEGGQEAENWDSLLEQAKEIAPASRWENRWTAEHSDCLIATGLAEQKALLSDYPGTSKVVSCQLGCDISGRSDGGRSFKEAHGVDDYVLCVGRLETRKNQLMLLKALEDSDLTVVLASGGFTYQPEYEEFCRSFKRNGKTIVVGRLDDNMLVSAYEGAKVHALASWYELPGLVSLEAAVHGCNVVVGRHGTSKDYFGKYAFYCDPGDPESIGNAVQAAYHSPVPVELKSHVERYTWDATADSIAEVYQAVIGRHQRSTNVQSNASRRVALDNLQNAPAGANVATRKVSAIPDAIADNQSFGDKASATALCEEADNLMRSGDYDKAIEVYRDASVKARNCARALRGQAVACMIKGHSREAESYFREALSIDSNDAKSLAGLGTVLLSQERTEEAFHFLLQAVEKDRCDHSVFLHLMNAAYALERFEELEDILRENTIGSGAQPDLLYCLAGCLAKQGKWNEAQKEIERLKEDEGLSSRVEELDELIRKGRQEGSKGSSLQATGVIEPKLIDDIRYLKSERKFEEVIQQVDKLLEGNTSLAADVEHELCCIYGESLAKTGKLEKAYAEYAKVPLKSKWYVRGLVGKGAVQVAMGHLDTGLSFFEEALKIDGQNDMAIAGIGIVQLQKGNSEEAWGQFVRALSINPENMRALFGIVEVGYLLDRASEIEGLLRNYLEYRPADLSFLYSLAGCLYHQARFDEALEEVKKIQLFDPQHTLAKELEGKIQEKLCGNRQERKSCG